MKRFNAFTLAELLITLAIIGVVAAVVLPSLMTNVNDKVNAEKIRSTKYKFTKATDHMKSLGLIGPYPSTDAFVDELQKYFKIAKRCDANDLRACWPYDTVKLQNDKEWDIVYTRTGKQLKMNDDDTHDYSSDNVGIITADGTPMILSYNKKCEALDPMKTYGWSTSNGKPETNATAGCVAAVFEINGTSRPNTFRKDVVAFNANGLGSSCTLEVNDKCFGAAFTPTPMTYAECAGENATSPGNITEAGSYAKSLGIKVCYDENDYWAGAVKQCGGVDKMPTRAELGKIASRLYKGNPTIDTNFAGTGIGGLKYNGKASQYGLPEPIFYIWAEKEFVNYDTFHTASDYLQFHPAGVGNNGGMYRDTSSWFGLCIQN